MKRLYVISGVAGMTGHELAIQILKNDPIANIIGFDNFFASNHLIVQKIQFHDMKFNRFKFYKYDISIERDMISLAKNIKNVARQFNELIFVHCAAVVSTKHFYRPFDTFEDNVIGTYKFLEIALNLRANKFINCSTSEVYSTSAWIEGGVKESSPVVIETAEQSFRTSYAVGKLLTEHLVKSAVNDGYIKGCSLRFANVYSPDEPNADHIIPYVIKSLKHDQSVTLLENAKFTKRTFLHNYDSCNSILHVINYEKSLDGSIYNVGTLDEWHILEVVNLIASKLGFKSIDVKYEGFRESDPTRRLLNCDKIREVTGWEPTISLEQGIEECVKNQ